MFSEFPFQRRLDCCCAPRCCPIGKEDPTDNSSLWLVRGRQVLASLAILEILVRAGPCVCFQVAYDCFSGYNIDKVLVLEIREYRPPVTLVVWASTVNFLDFCPLFSET